MSYDCAIQEAKETLAALMLAKQKEEHENDVKDPIKDVVEE